MIPIPFRFEDTFSESFPVNQGIIPFFFPIPSYPGMSVGGTSKLDKMLPVFSHNPPPHQLVMKGSVSTITRRASMPIKDDADVEY